MLLLTLGLFLGFMVLLSFCSSKVEFSSTSFLVDGPDDTPKSSGPPFSLIDVTAVHYHGGRLLVEPIVVYLIWLGPWEDKSKEALRNAVRSLSVESGDGLPDLFNWWKVATQYTDGNGQPVSSNVSLGTVECSSSTASNLSREALTSLMLQAFNVSSSPSETPPLCSSVLPQDETAVYHLLFSEKVSFSEDFHTSLCSRRFRLFKAEEVGPELSLAWSREPGGAEYCNLWSYYHEFLSPPNAKDKGQLDSLISSVLAQTVSMATNTDFDGWHSNLSSTVTTLCPSPTGLSISAKPVIDDGKISWNLSGINGYRYMVQQIWSDKTKLCALHSYEHCKGLRERNDYHGIISEGLIVNHSVGLQPYSHGLHCEWRVSMPGAAVVRVKINYMAIVKNVDYVYLHSCFAPVYIYRLDACLEKMYSGLGSPHQLELYTSEFLLEFKTGNNPTLTEMGWDIAYQAGFCFGTTRVTEKSGVLTDGTPENATYLEQHTCAWFLDGPNVELDFVRFDTVQNQDELLVYRGDKSDVANIVRVYTGRYSSLPRETFPGPVLLEFRTKTGNGRGWALKYTIKPAGGLSPPEDPAVIIAAVCGGLGGMLVAGLIVLTYMRRVLLLFDDNDREMERPLLLPKNIKVFSPQVLREATDKFSSSNLISRGRRACVYRAKLPDEQQVVVKKTKLARDELLVISSASHFNIVGVTGYCFNRKENFLVLEYVPNGSLADHLFSNASTLAWSSRLRIAVQVSSALEFLHSYVEPSITHGHVSSDNILLDKSWNAKLAGFGSSRRSCVKRVGSHNFGLKAEEVYRFGGLVMELVTGDRSSSKARRACEVIESGKEEMLGLVLDRRCGSNDVTDKRAVLKLAEVGAWCMTKEAKERPTMVEVASALRQVLAISMRSRR
ncbi:uncharacterized protein LOC9661189 [Selaginella moellendorffii]|nr:uncharacterized protein LOC9661189 [Selaginella moellendorffii]|eukprot:XP_002962591.2 uncharacterized protein LOC9661189 [Selaginella moellendorffii]